MTTTTTTTAADEVDLPRLGALLAASAKSDRERIAVLALAEEEQILARANVRAALVVKDDGHMACRWESLSGRLYSLGLDEGERAFLGLLVSMVGVGHITTLAAVEYLDERRLMIIQRVILRLAGNDRIAIGTRL